ncbi:hypothetical protein ACP70R_005646 [Stipagrostis hirtigluma subsp. patula]
MATPVCPTLSRLEATASPRQPPALTDDLLEEIFLRLAAPADLARASTACASFRRLVADPVFLAKYRSRHPPLLLGFIDSVSEGFHPTKAPHPNAPAARAFAGAADFSFDYLPRRSGSEWYLYDARDGRVLLGSIPDDEDAFLDLAVCCPLSRRYLLLPPLPDDIFQVQEQRFQGFDTFLVPSGDWEDTSFRVIANAHYTKRLAVFIFSSGSNQWDAGTFTSWDALKLPPNSQMRVWFGTMTFSLRCACAYGCFYWKLHLSNKVIKFDMNNLEFCTVDLPPDFDKRKIVIVEAGEGMLGMFSLINNGTAVHYTIRQNLSESSNESKMDNIIPLPVGYVCDIVGASGGCIFLVSYPTTGRPHSVCLSLDMKTLKIEIHSNEIRPYFGYPPFMSPRRI